MRMRWSNTAMPESIKPCTKNSEMSTSTFELIYLISYILLHSPTFHQSTPKPPSSTSFLPFLSQMISYFKICRFDSHLDIIKEKLLFPCLASTMISPKSKRLPRILPTSKRQDLQGGSRRPSCRLKKRPKESILL